MNATSLPVAIVSGIPEELAGVRRRLEDTRVLSFGSGRAWRGRIGQHEVVLAVAGDGPARARRVIEALLSSVPCSGVLGLGVAGGLSADLAPGDLVVAESIVDGDGALLAVDAAWVEAAVDAGARRATVIAADRLAATTLDKAKLRQATSDPTAVVDLESASWARGATARGLPAVILRVVSDSWDEDLPEFLVGCQREDGSVARGRIAIRAIAIPSRIPPLLRLAGRVRRASVQLASIAGAIMGEASAELNDRLSREAS